LSDEELTDHAARSRAWWDERAETYQRERGEHIGRPEPCWGLWQLPESELRILGDVAGKDVLELGCGAAQWPVLLAGLGARPVGLDYSGACASAGRRLRLQRLDSARGPLLERG